MCNSAALWRMPGWHSASVKWKKQWYKWWQGSVLEEISCVRVESWRLFQADLSLLIMYKTCSYFKRGMATCRPESCRGLLFQQKLLQLDPKHLLGEGRGGTFFSRTVRMLMCVVRCFYISIILLFWRSTVTLSKLLMRWKVCFLFWNTLASFCSVPRSIFSLCVFRMSYQNKPPFSVSVWIVYIGAQRDRWEEVEQLHSRGFLLPTFL